MNEYNGNKPQQPEKGTANRGSLAKLGRALSNLTSEAITLTTLSIEKHNIKEQLKLKEQRYKDDSNYIIKFLYRGLENAIKSNKIEAFIPLKEIIHKDDENTVFIYPYPFNELSRTFDYRIVLGIDNLIPTDENKIKTFIKNALHNQPYDVESLVINYGFNADYPYDTIDLCIKATGVKNYD